MMILFKATCNELSTAVFCVSAIQNTGRNFSEKNSCLLGVKRHGLSYGVPVNHDQICLTDVPNNYRQIGSCVVRFHAVNEQSCLSCIGGQNYITLKEAWECPNKICDIGTMDTPTDICSDDYGHIYVSGQGSNNIHRLTDAMEKMRKKYYCEQDWKVLDIPLDAQHGIKEPVALCFNQDFSKLYIVNEWAKFVLVFDVVCFVFQHIWNDA
ncbi:unnamed protein product [Mytilus edulis]|uniref:Uncharacterized protein n=1 Tax=Mytilus edulis TaxID=6550 RepID=A0A8S3PP75_MYTED|nr:unnamed protein product [Mytilus edulis]